jgi:hypothetical protein
MTRLRQCSRMTPQPTTRDQTANASGDSPADGIQGDHAGQQECLYQQRCAALPVASYPSDHDLGPGNQQ